MKLVSHKPTADGKFIDLFFDAYPSNAEIAEACKDVGIEWDGSADTGNEGYGDFPKRVRVRAPAKPAPPPTPTPAPEPTEPVDLKT